MLSRHSRPHHGLDRATVLLSLLLCGCGTSALPPGVSVEFRHSIFGLGKVVQITNSSSHHLYNVRVVGRNFKQASSASVKATEHLPPGATIEVGWYEFGTWMPEPGESIEVYADSYATPHISIVP